MDKTIDDVIKEIEQLALENSSQSIWVEVGSVESGDAEKMIVEISLSDEPDTPGDWFCYGVIKEIFVFSPLMAEFAIENAIECMAEDRKDEVTAEQLLEDMYSRKPSFLTEKDIAKIKEDATANILENMAVEDHIFYLPSYIKENLNKLQLVHV